MVAVLSTSALVLVLMNQPETDRRNPNSRVREDVKNGEEHDSDPINILASLSSKLGSGEILQLLNRMKASLLAMPRGEATSWIKAYLNTGKDQPTGLGFVIGNNQNLTEWPSIRAFLIDVLFAIDPAAAAEVGRQVLASTTTPDEWALAMRNVARGAANHSETVSFLKQKCEELLHHASWRQNPTDGYLQAFDVIVHVRNTALTPELMAFCADANNRAVRHAAFLALDRLVQAEPGEMLAALANENSSSGLMVSNMIARADVRNAPERAAVEKWLLDERRTVAELQGFAGVFPNANQMVSYNLLTETVTLDGAAGALRDRGALKVVEEWLIDPRFSRVQDLLRETRERLREFVKP